jgi:hypothetical protein
MYEELYFQGEGGRLDNDDVRTSPPVPLRDGVYVFQLLPETPFWRFGLRFAKSTDIVYEPTRYANPQFKDIQVVVGVMDSNNEWSNPNIIELGHYHQFEKFTGNNPLFQRNTYLPRTPVRLEVIYTSADENLFVSLKYDDTKPLTYDFEITGYTHFQLSAWADYKDFSLRCAFTFPEKKSQKKQTTIRHKNLVFIRQDMLDPVVLKNTDMIVLPASTSGTVQPQIEDWAKKHGALLPGPGKAGRVGFHGRSKGKKPNEWTWAYSVMNQQSRREYIVDICDDLVEHFQSRMRGKETVAMPLLGTGAGKLPIEDVVETYIKILTTLSNGPVFNIYINNNEQFEEVEKILRFPNSKPKPTKLSYTKSGVRFRDRTNVDPVLGVTELAKDIGSVIKLLPTNELGTMIGVFGKWGRGKSYFIDRLWKYLSQAPDNKFKKIEFHAWKYQDTPAIWAYLYERFSEEYFKGSNWFAKGWKRFVLNGARIGYIKLVKFLLLLAIAIYFTFGIPFELKFRWALQFISAIGGIIVVFHIIHLYFKYKGTAINLFNEYYSKISFSKYLGTQAEVQKELIYLLEAWCGKRKKDGTRVLLYVEDIDRCSENKIIDIVDALRVMLEDSYIASKVTVVAAIDENILRNAIRLKYDSLIEKNETIDPFPQLIGQYFDKLFIIGILLGELSPGEKDQFFIKLSEDDRIEKNVPPYISHAPIKITEVNNLKRDPPEVEQSERREVDPQTLSADKGNEQTMNIFKKLFATVRKGVRAAATVLLDNEKKRSADEVDKLTSAEVEILREAIRNSSELTPRQIRIIYYRYLIAKVLLDSEYSRVNRENVWFTGAYPSTLIDDILHYSKPGGRQELESHKKAAIHSKEQKLAGFNNKKLEIQTEDYCQLLRILDIVVAY